MPTEIKPAQRMSLWLACDQCDKTETFFYDEGFSAPMPDLGDWRAPFRSNHGRAFCSRACAEEFHKAALRKFLTLAEASE